MFGMQRLDSRVYSRAAAVALAGLVVSWSGLVSLINRGPAGSMIDDGIYLVSAQSLSDGQGYRLPSRPGNPPSDRYPVGWPSMIAVVLRFAPGSRSLNH